jgi:tRNA-(ms[2]io[6]A)-hydroxylase
MAADSDTVDIGPIRDFLSCDTPPGWLAGARCNLELLLIDHANCEKKAASTALNLLYRYTAHPDLLHRLSRLAREELRHFEQVLAIMERRGIAYVPVSASRYAAGLRDGVRSEEPGRLVDTLIVGAVIEARSCERFAALVPVVDDELARFYTSLLRSEARHFKDYLTLATRVSDREEVSRRKQHFCALDAELISSEDADFRFHSGVPVEEKALTA